MVGVHFLPPDDPIPEERHVAVIVHRDITLANQEKAYFYDSAEDDFGGSGPFDWRLDEAIERAKQFATDKKIEKVIEKAEQP